jgi:hypothetical protein
MKITKQQLKQIIKEELESLLERELAEDDILGRIEGKINLDTYDVTLVIDGQQYRNKVLKTAHPSAMKHYQDRMLEYHRDLRGEMGDRKNPKGYLAEAGKFLLIAAFKIMGVDHTGGVDPNVGLKLIQKLSRR